VARVTRTGVLPEQIYLEYSQSRLSASALRPAALLRALTGRNTTASGGQIAIGGRALLIDPAAEFTSATDIGNVIVDQSSGGRPVYLRDSVDILRGYQTPPRALNFQTVRQADGTWRRARAVTESVQ
jgi:multidrug efflux pump subunit AcrB